MTALVNSHEWLKQYLYSPPYDSTPGIAEWVGSAPRLSTEDAGTSYADIQDVNEAYPAVTLAPTTRLRGDIRVRVQIRVPDLVTPWDFTLNIGYESDPLGWDSTGVNANDPITVTTDQWETHELVMDLHPDDRAPLEDTYAPAGMVTAYVDHNSVSTPRYYVSLIQVHAGRSVVRHGIRNDGLRSTGPRRWGQESSFQSGRGGGYP